MLVRISYPVVIDNPILGLITTKLNFLLQSFPLCCVFFAAQWSHHLHRLRLREFCYLVAAPLGTWQKTQLKSLKLDLLCLGQKWHPSFLAVSPLAITSHMGLSSCKRTIKLHMERLMSTIICHSSHTEFFCSFKTTSTVYLYFLYIFVMPVIKSPSVLHYVFFPVIHSPNALSVMLWESSHPT